MAGQARFVLRGRYAPTDFLWAHWLALKPRDGVWAAGVMTALLAPPMLALSLLLRGGEWGGWDVGIVVGGLFWCYVLLVGPWWRIRQAFRRMPALNQWYVAVVDGEGVHGGFPDVEGFTPWDAISAYRMNHRVVLLYLEPHRYLVIPQRFFRDPREHAAFLRFVRWQFGHCARCGYTLRGNQTAACPECGVAVA